MDQFGSVGALLDAHGLSGAPEAPFEHSGFSGARMTRLTRRDAGFILKRMDIERDWIMRATADAPSREAALAAADVDLGATIRTPAIGVSRDGDGWALLMADISAQMLPPGPISTARLDAIIEGMADLHRRAAPTGIPWCDVGRRLTLLTPATARVAAEYGAPVARDIIDGWRLFDRLAPPSVSTLLRQLHDDPSPLLAALHRLPASLLHGDLKLDNIGLDGKGTLWLIDWALTLVAPPAVELGWFMAINSRRLPVSLDDVIERYARAAALSDGLRARHDALAVLCGLVLRGWRKALDAHEGEPAELRWWCERVERAAEML